eukprot:jgi/Picre1/27505/NNA_000472.t1
MGTQQCCKHVRPFLDSSVVVKKTSETRSVDRTIIIFETGFVNVPPNNYPFYNDDEKYVPVMQADGGQLSEWKPMYNPTNEQAEADRQKAYETGIPHGYVAQGDKYKGLPTIALPVISDLHTSDEYGEKVDKSTGKHSGGPFVLHVRSKDED